MNYYKFHIGDYRKDTMHLTRLEHSIYRDLIDLYYLEEKPIPNETQWVIRRLRLITQEEKDALQSVLSDFFSLENGVFRHKKIDDDLESYRQNSDKNKENGKKGGRPKSKKTNEKEDEKTQSVSSGFQEETEAEPNQKATINHKPLTINHNPFVFTKELSVSHAHTQEPKTITIPNSHSKPTFERFAEQFQISLAHLGLTDAEIKRMYADFEAMDWVDANGRHFGQTWKTKAIYRARDFVKDRAKAENPYSKPLDLNQTESVVNAWLKSAEVV